MEVSELNCHLLSSPTRGSKIHGQSKGLKTVAIIEVKSGEFVGLGEAYVGIYIPELTLKIVNHISSNIIGMDIETSMEKIRTFKAPFVSNAGIYKSILGSIEVALYDLQARIKEIPLYKLFSNDAFSPFSLCVRRECNYFYKGTR